MKYFIAKSIMIYFFTSASIFAQMNGEDIGSLIAKVEGETQGELEITWKTETESMVDKELLQQFKDYWKHYSKQRYYKCYDMYFNVYKEHVDLDAFMNHKRMKVKSIAVISLSSEKGSCAVFRLIYHGQGGMFDMAGIKMTQKWTLEDGKWAIFSDPFKELESMGFSPPGSKSKQPVFPCEEKLSSTKKTVSPL